MIQGTTPTWVLTLPCQADTLVAAELTLSDSKGVIRTWTLKDMQAEANRLSIKLTQKETMTFAVGLYMLQLRVKFNNGEVAASNMFSIGIEDLKSEVEI